MLARFAECIKINALSAVLRVLLCAVWAVSVSHGESIPPRITAPVCAAVRFCARVIALLYRICAAPSSIFFSIRWRYPQYVQAVGRVPVVPELVGIVGAAAHGVEL